MSTYKSIEVLEIEPNRADDMGESFVRSLAVFDPATTPPLIMDRSGFNQGQIKSFNLSLDGREEIAAFLTFRDARFGRQKKFWMPTWQEDLIAVNDVADGDTGLTIKDCGYSQFVFPNLPRQFIAIIQPGPTFLYRKITAATANGVTESLTVDVALPDLLVGRYAISFLTLRRLDDDDVELVWTTPNYCEVSLTLTELPLEVPA
jgi:hypothetical protein